MRKISLKILFAVAFCLSVGVTARASTITFNFNTLNENDSAALISAYMTNQLKLQLGCTTCKVTVTGAVADTTYNGDGHVTGPGNGSASLTLGTSDGATGSYATSTLNPSKDVFIANTNDSSGQIANQFSLAFSGVTLSGASFDYEVFPDGTAEQPPSLVFMVGANTVATLVGVTPGTTNGTAVHSPASGQINKETSAQLIGTGSWNFASGVNPTLTFVDWPATVAIDNLKVTAVPEPGTMLLFGTGLASLIAMKRKKHKPQMHLF